METKRYLIILLIIGLIISIFVVGTNIEKLSKANDISGIKYSNLKNNISLDNISVEYINKVSVNDTLKIKITPPKEGIFEYVYIYTASNADIDIILLNCNTSFCFDEQTISYDIHAFWTSGEYYFRIYDYSEKKYKKFYFEVIDGATQKNLSVEYNKNVSANDTLDIKITPPNEGIHKYVYFYTDLNMYKAMIILKYDTYSKYCFDEQTISFDIPASWTSGEYYFQIGDISGGIYNQFYFNVINGVAKKTLSVEYNKNVSANDTLDIKITPPNDGINKYMSIYTTSNIEKDMILLDYDTYNNYCFDEQTVSYDIPASWTSGAYYFEIYDYSEEKNRQFYFTVIKGAAKINLSVEYNKNVSANDTLDIKITPPNDGIYMFVDIYTTSNTYKDALVMDLNTSYFNSEYYCFDEQTISYNIPALWASGEYYFRIYDYSEKKYKQFYFTVIDGVAKKTLSVKYNKNIPANGTLDIKITPPNEGINKHVEIYNTNLMFYKDEIMLDCDTYPECFDEQTISYDIPASWTLGAYYFRIYDYSEYKYKLFHFEVSK